MGKGGLEEDTHLLLTDGEYWIKADVTNNVKEHIKEGLLDVDDVVEIWKTVGVITNLVIVSVTIKFLIPNT